VISVVPTAVANTYTITVAPTDNGAVTVKVAAGAVKDLAGNDNTASNEITRTYDTVAPTVTLASDPAVLPELLNSNYMPLTNVVTFSEAVVGFGADMVTVANGAVADVIESQDPETTNMVFTVVILPENEDVTSISVQIEANKVTDKAGNLNEESNTLEYSCILKRPTVGIVHTSDVVTVDSTNYFNTVKLTLSVTFSADVTNFTSSCVTLSSGTCTIAPAPGAPASSYVMTIDSMAEGLLTVEIEENKVRDLAGNGNYASEQLFFVSDHNKPLAPKITGTPDNNETVNTTNFSFEAKPNDDDDGDTYSYAWKLNGHSFTGQANSDNAKAAKWFVEGSNTISVVAFDRAGNQSFRTERTWVYEKGTSSLDFGGDVAFDLIDSDTGATNKVAFTAVDFKPGAASTLTMSGFTAPEGEISNLQMWFLVSYALGDEPTHVKADTTANYESGELTVTLPSAATEGQDSFFVHGIDNKAE
jgi:hypothetical protein